MNQISSLGYHYENNNGSCSLFQIIDGDATLLKSWEGEIIEREGFLYLFSNNMLYDLYNDCGSIMLEVHQGEM